MRRRSKRQKRVSRLKGANKSKIMKINLSLLIGIILAVLILFSSLTGHKISTIGTRILANLAEDTNSVASTLTTEYSSIYNVGASTINITDIEWNNPDSISTTGDLSYMTFTDSASSIFIYWTGSTFSSGETKEGTYTILYENVGNDKYGRAIDMKIEGSVTGNQASTDAYEMNSERYYGVCELRTRYPRIGSISWDIGMTSYSMALINVYSELDVTFTIHDTENEAEGQFLFYIYNIDVLRTEPRYTESVKLGDGFSNTVYLPEDSTLELVDDWFTPICDATDTDDTRSCLTTLTDGSAFSFSHKSGGAMTKVFELFNQCSIVSNIYTSTDGGTTYTASKVGAYLEIYNQTCSMTEDLQKSTNYTLTTFWKNTYTYYPTVLTGYHLVKIVYDDTEIKYTPWEFEEVTSDHTLDVYLVANSYSVLFDGNGATSGTTDDMEDLYYDTTYTLNTNGFVRSGYTFTGWNTESDGSGTSYTDEESFSNLKSTDGGTVTLYAQWEGDSGTISVYYVDINTDEILDLYSYTGSVGETVTTSGKEIDGYTLVESPETEEYTLTNEDINVYYYYAKDSNVIVYYLNYYTNEEIEESETIDGYEGLSYTTEQKEIDEYTYLSNSGNTEGTMSSETTYVYYYYEQLISITITKVSTETSTDEDGNTVYTYLEGIQFQLYELICDNAAHNHDTDEDLIDTADYDEDCWELIGTYTTEEDGTFILSNLPISGIYRLVETKTIEDYVLPSGQWKIEFDYDDNLTGTTYTVNGVELQVTGINNPPAISLIDDTLYLYNTESYDIPTTGLLGFDDFWKIGVLIILMGMIIYPIRKKKKVSKSKFGSTRESVNNARHIINNWDKRK